MCRYAESKAHRDRYGVDFQRLYVETIYPALVAADRSRRPWVDSSPSNGVLTRRPYIKRWGDVQSPSFGDVHYYNYDAGELLQ